MFRKNLIWLAVMLSICIFWNYSQGATHSFQGLGDLAGGIFWSEPWNISADGSTVLGSSYSALGREAFRWTQETGLVGLGDFSGGNCESVASDSSSDGLIVVGLGTEDSDSESFRWTQETGMVTLAGAFGGSSQALAVSADGSAIAGWFHDGSAYEAYRWTQATGMAALGDLPGGQNHSTAEAISPDGSVVAGYSFSASGREAFRWTQEDGIIGLGDLPGGNFASGAVAVLADGSIYGSSHSDSGTDNGYEVFRWTEQEGMSAVGTSISPRRGSVSADGSVIVGTMNNDAYIWDAINGTRALESELTAYGVDLTGWNLYDVQGVSADGKIITGWGVHPDGSREAWIATIPEPITLTLLLIGSLAVFRRSFRH